MEFGRAVGTVVLAVSDQATLLSFETNETAINAIRRRFGRSAVPAAVGVWNWWVTAAAGFFAALCEAAQPRFAGSAPIGSRRHGELAIEVDLTESPKADAPACQSAAGARK